MKSSQSSSQALFAVLRNSLPGLSERRQRGSDNWEATTRKRQLGSDNSEATTWERQLGSDNSEATIRKRQLGSDNLEATTRKRQLKKIYTKYIYTGGGDKKLANKKLNKLLLSSYTFTRHPLNHLSHCNRLSLQKWKRQLGSDNSEATTRKRQIRSDNSEATTQKRQLVTLIGFRTHHSEDVGKRPKAERGLSKPGSEAIFKECGVILRVEVMSLVSLSALSSVQTPRSE